MQKYKCKKLLNENITKQNTRENSYKKVSTTTEEKDMQNEWEPMEKAI